MSVNTQQALLMAWQHHQAGRLPEAERIYRQVLDVEPRNADALGLLGMIALQVGNSGTAAELLGRAVALAPAHPDLVRYLGDAYLNLGRLTEAEACYRKLLTLKPDDAGAHNKLGTVLQALGRLEEAEGSYRQALAHKPAFAAGVHNNLGVLYMVRGRLHDAAAEFRAALAVDPELAEAHCNLAGVFHQLGDMDAAIKCCHQALAAKPSLARAHNTLGNIYLDQCRIGEAITSFRGALACLPDLTAAQINLALAMRANGEGLGALRVLFDGLASQPTSIPLRRALAEALQRVPLGSAGAQERAILASLCGDDAISMPYLTHAVASIVKGDTAFPALLRAVRGDEDPFACAPGAVDNWTRDSVLLSALPRMTFQDIELELALTGLRRRILLRALADGELRPTEVTARHEFICALARNCFLSGYAFFAAEDEAKMARDVDERLNAAMGRPTTDRSELESLLTLAALYRPLNLVTGCERLLDPVLAGWNAAFQPILREQLINRRRENEISGSLAVMTEVKDDVSRAVLKQYEDNPYPPWVSAGSPEPEIVEDIARRLRPGEQIGPFPRPVAVLVAGCGTGHQAVTAARHYRDCEILAVDLSRASLAYAARMAEQLGISNITFAQADILELGRLERRFAIIECAGVLHHMRDLMEGWRVLAGLLLPGGLMTIGLYSEQARGSIRAAHEFVRARAFNATADGIRRCRRAIIELPEGHPARGVTAFGDFFSLNGCRDLIMHVHEQTVTLPRVAQYLEELGMRFLGFSCDAWVLARFHDIFPDKAARTDLALWNRFEGACPSAFRGMYEFWCCKR
jgi:tetratricopeptide (TPR) repeat protein/SAM-dependent methyltransferase